ncbi:MAG: SDR family NAD(P)-dependent oxidoreductase, partial [Trebonia sp.]
AQVIVHGRNGPRLRELAAEFSGQAVVGDLTAVHAAEDLAAAAGPVDVLVHCAGLGWKGPVAEIADAEVAAIFAVNVLAPIALTRLMVPYMDKNGQGHVSFVGSIAGLTGVAEEAVYSASKAALLTFADSVRLEYAGTGVEVSTVSPGAVATGFLTSNGYRRRIPRPLEPERVAAEVLRAIESGGGSRVLPRWLRLAPLVRAAAPNTYHALAHRFG